MIFVSTGGHASQPAYTTVEQFIDAGIRAIELSGGRYAPDLQARLQALGRTAILQPHNYFPPPERPFVFNLASPDAAIAAASVELARTGIRWSAAFGREVFACHAGFRVDPQVAELGGNLTARSLVERDRCRALFLERIDPLAEFAAGLGVRLLVENNVVSARNYREFDADPFLLTTPDECEWLLEHAHANVGVLIDVAHLNVSAHTLGFAREPALERCAEYADAYHLSDNDGLEDRNRPIAADSWFWPYVQRGLAYYSLEIYRLTPAELAAQLRLAEEILETA